jgi:hypothetical protein
VSAFDSSPKPQTNTGLLIGSILATLFCCLPLGIVAIVFAAKGDDAKARTWLIAAVIVGLVANVFGWFIWFRD